MKVQIEKSWGNILDLEFKKTYFKDIVNFVKMEYMGGQVYPPRNKIFNAFNNCPFDEVRVVIIGQDPYHGLGQANGLCFSVSDGIKKPPSLQNIFKELKSDLGIEIPESGNLERWAKQGVFLLNSILTVRAGAPASHHNNGWETFTNEAIKIISDKKENIVFLLWGAFAQKKAGLIDSKKHCILKAAHPSPFSAYRGYFGCKHFSKTNVFLKKHGFEPIEW